MGAGARRGRGRLSRRSGRRLPPRHAQGRPELGGERLGEAAGYAATEPELIRDLYACAAQHWVDQGRTRHYALVPRLDDQVDAWFRLGFGAQQAHGIAEVNARPWPPGARRAASGDIDELVELIPFLSRHQARAPTFNGLDPEPSQSDEELRAWSPRRSRTRSWASWCTTRPAVVASFEIVPSRKPRCTAALSNPTALPASAGR